MTGVRLNVIRLQPVASAVSNIFVGIPQDSIEESTAHRVADGLAHIVLSIGRDELIVGNLCFLCCCTYGESCDETHFLAVTNPAPVCWSSASTASTHDWLG